jgi:hypothetical protein
VVADWVSARPFTALGKVSFPTPVTLQKRQAATHSYLLNWAAPFFQSSVSVMTGCSKQSWAWLEAAAAVVTRTKVRPKLSPNHSNKSVTPPLSTPPTFRQHTRNNRPTTPESSTRQLLV